MTVNWNVIFGPDAVVPEAPIVPLLLATSAGGLNSPADQPTPARQGQRPRSSQLASDLSHHFVANIEVGVDLLDVVVLFQGVYEAQSLTGGG